MDVNALGFKRAIGVNYTGILKKFPKSHKKIQPLFEAFTNALEALKQSDSDGDEKSICIIIELEYKNRVNDIAGYDFIGIEISDTGVGLNDAQFERLLNLNDTSKGFHNRGSGRVQFLNYFERTICESVYRSGSELFRRVFTMSKSSEYLDTNSFVKLEYFGKVNSAIRQTKIRFTNPLSKKDEEYFSNLTAEEIKSEILRRYLPYFCDNIEDLPTISIKQYVNGGVIAELVIARDDIPSSDYESEIKVKFSRFADDGKTIERIDKESQFYIKGFRLPQSELEENHAYLVSKGETSTEIELEYLRSADVVNGNRYLILISGEYINENDDDERGNIKFVSNKDFRKGLQIDVLNSEIIVKEDLQKEVENEVVKAFAEILEVRVQKEKSVDELKELFLLNDETLQNISFKLNDSDQEILRKVYTADSANVARRDAEIKTKLEKVKSLDTTSSSYNEDLEKQINDVVELIPLQNRTALTHYVARRKIVLELFDCILKNELNRQNDGSRNINEKLLHNLIFQQTSNNTSKSDLWLINEDFIYFDGCSEFKLSEVLIDNERIFRDDIDEYEEKMLNALGEKRQYKKPDILLFPSEGKAIIIELKAPNVNVSDYLNQISRYASLLRKFSKNKFELTQFFGYLIGEAIDNNDVRDHDADFRSSYHFDYLFRARKPVNGLDGQVDGDLYMEVIKYSTLLERAKQRNQIFIEKILGKNIDS